ncbi:class I adenylate-forming enzyme family protein [Jatrophihabitans sp. YIM 134969]
MSDTYNLARRIVEVAEHRPDLRFGCVGDVITLRDAVGYAAARAWSLLDSGIRPGESVALLAPTSTDYLVSWLACVLAGTPAALVNPTYPGPLIDQMLTPLAPAALWTDAQIARARTSSQTSVDTLPGLAADRYDVVSYMHTSGTTGVPKFCAQTHEYFRRLSDAMGGALELTADDTVLAPLPMFHINPMGYGTVTALLHGANALTVPRFSASGFWPAVLDEQVSVLVLHAPPVEILKRATTTSDAAGHQVRTMFYADREFMHRFGVDRAVSGYGSTEAGGVTHLHRWSRDDEIPDDASRHGGGARSDVAWRLDAHGLIEVRETDRAALFDGYVTDHGLDPARDDDGWFATGDLGRVDDGDHLVFLERAAESIRVKGEFVPIPFVENHLAGAPGLTDHALWKRRGALVDDEVVLYAVADRLPLEELRTRIAGLPAFMRPVAVAHVAALPRDAAAGKVQRRLLGEQPVLAWVELG